MFERYSERARRLLFFARYETSATGALTIESEHLLLGLLREPGPIVRRVFAAAGASGEQLRQEVEQRIAFQERVATSVEIPFGERTKHILQYTAEEADNLKHSHIGPEHVLLALLRVPEATAGAILAGHGLRLQATRDAVAALIAEGAASTSRHAAEYETDAPESGERRADTDGVVADIDRIVRLVERLRMKLPAPPDEASEVLHMIYFELASLRGRFS